MKPVAGSSDRAASRGRAILGTVVAVLALVSGALAPTSPAAHADTLPTNPTDPRTPETVAADGLPTVQIDGVVWSQAIAGNRVYAGGNFTSARPAGSAAGTNTTPRSNMLAYDLQTGQLISSFAPTFNGQVRAVAAAPDGSIVYVGGDFTTVNGLTRRRIAAFDAATGTLLPFAPSMSHYVYAISVSAGKVYVGGSFSAVGATPRAGLAAFTSSGTLLDWAPTTAGGWPWAIVASPDGSKVVAGGNFTTANGSSNPGYGLAAFDGVTGGLLPWAVNGVVRNGGENSAILALTTDGDNVYGSGYVFGSGGNLEGSFSADWNGGTINWIEDCHGDTYSVFPAGQVVYAVGHPHYCGNIGGFPQTDPWSFYRGLAFSKSATGTITRDPHGYFNFAGNPAPSPLNFYPSIDTGTFTGMGQGPWHVTGSGGYVVMGGEFRNINGTPQQGLVRFAVKEIAPNKQRPRESGADWNVRVDSLASGTARVAIPSNWDRDNETLTYRVYRNNLSTVVYETTVTTPFFRPQPIAFWDSGLTPGSSHQYKVRAYDGFGNFAESLWVPVTISGNDTVDGYAAKVLADGPANYWRLGEASGTTLANWAGGLYGTAGAGVTRGAVGALNVDDDTASTFNGSSNGIAYTNAPQPPPDTFTLEAWVRTTTNRGGKIIGYGNRNTSNSSIYDRQLYMDNSGRIWFGVNPGSAVTINSPQSYNNGQWHHIAASLGPNGMMLYVDGRTVAQRTDTATAQRGTFGYWRIGGDQLNGWPSRPTSNFLSGTVDEVAVYHRVLTPQQVDRHWVASGRTSNLPNVAPTASFTTSVNNPAIGVDGSGSSDPDGSVVSYSWNFGDGTTATGPTASHTYAAAGTYTVTLTVTDDDGATGTTSQQVDITGPPAIVPFAIDTFDRTVTNGLGTADLGGTWTLAGTSTNFSVNGSAAGIRMNTAGTGPGAYLASVSSTDTDVTAQITFDKPATGGGINAWVVTRRVNASSDYRAKVKVLSNGTVQVSLARFVGGAEQVLVSQNAPFTWAVGQTLQLRAQTTGTSPTTLRAKVWKVGETEPVDWQVSTSDSTAGIQAPGGIGLYTYLSASAVNAPVIAYFDNLRATPTD